MTESNAAETHFVNGHRIRPPFPAGLHEATFGLGCFWGAERRFWQLPGVYATAVGYAGGHVANPGYKLVCTDTTGHAEVVRVLFDPAKIAYAELLRVFWESHDPTQGNRQGADIGTQYRSAIFWHGEAQHAAAERIAGGDRPVREEHRQRRRCALGVVAPEDDRGRRPLGQPAMQAGRQDELSREGAAGEGPADLAPGDGLAAERWGPRIGDVGGLPREVDGHRADADPPRVQRAKR